MLKPIIKDGLVVLLDENSPEYSESAAKVSTKIIKANKGNMKEPAIDKRSDKSEELELE